MVDYSVCDRYFVPETYTVTCITVNGEAVFDDKVKCHLLLSVLERFEARRQLRLLAYLFLPEQIHLLIALGQARAIDDIVQRLKTEYCREYATIMGNPGRMMLFEQRHRLQQLADREEFATQLDDLHYKPVELGLVPRPEEWSHSSYELWVERRLYKLGWGWEKPRSIG